MKFWIEFFKDKRFGWRFKIANFIMNDYLRNYLSVGALLPLRRIIEEKSYIKIKTEAQKAHDSITKIMEM